MAWVWNYHFIPITFTHRNHTVVWELRNHQKEATGTLKLALFIFLNGSPHGAFSCLSGGHLEVDAVQAVAINIVRNLPLLSVVLTQLS